IATPRRRCFAPDLPSSSGARATTCAASLCARNDLLAQGPPPGQHPPVGFFDRAARLADRIRFLFVPVALCALVAVGAHAAAEVASERILSVVDALDSALDSFFSRFSLTTPLVDLIGPAQRIGFSRALALVWELCADAFLALPLLGYDERADEVKRFRALCEKAWKRPTTLRIVRPLATAVIALAGACSTARLLQGSLHLALHGGPVPGLF